jgi:hypothetical protein
MGHGLFPNWGMTYIKQSPEFYKLSKKERTEVFFPKMKKKITGRNKIKEEEEPIKKGKKR